jgi:hypothetical protein
LNVDTQGRWRLRSLPRVPAMICPPAAGGAAVSGESHAELSSSY